MIYATLARHTKPNGIQVLQCVDYVIPQDWDGGTQLNWENDCFSPHHRMVYLVVRLRDEWLDTCKVAVQEDGEMLRSGGFYSIDELAELVGISDLRERMASNESIPIIDGTGLSTSSWCDNSVIEFEYVEDTAVWTTGIASIQAGGGGDYISQATFSADTSLGSADLGCKYDSAVTETGTSTYDGNHGAYTIEIYDGSPCLGDPTAGNLVTVNISSRFIYDRLDGSGDFKVHDLRVVHSNDGERTITTSGVIGGHYVCFYNNMVDYNSTNPATAGVYNTDPDALLKAYGNVLWGINGTGYAIYTLGSGSYAENNTIYCPDGRGITANNTDLVCRNNIVIANVSYAFAGISTAASGYNNYSAGTTGEDADFSTGSDNITSGTTAVFVSTDDTSSDFLKPVAASAIDGAATTPTLWTTDIAGNPYNGTIGAQQIVAAGVAAGPYVAEPYSKPFHAGAWR